MKVQLLKNGALIWDGKMVARIVYASPGLAEAVRATVERVLRGELRRRIELLGFERS